MRSAVRVELLIPLIILSIFTCSARGMLCKQAEREALLDFKLSFTDDPLEALSSWSPHNPDCCTQWGYGVGCDDHTGHVVSLEVGEILESHRLRPSLLVLQHLTYLDLSWNNFPMKIPEFISSLANLEYLDLSYSGFYGKIPPHLANLTRLETLWLGGWSTLGESPSLLHSDNMQWLPHLSSLQDLELFEVNLSISTDWLSSLKRLHSISQFTCSGCSFSLTPQPVSFSCPHNHSTSLQGLDLSGSQISFPDFLCLINGTSNLTSLSLESMEQNPDDFFRPLFQSASRSMLFPTLESLDISGNQLSDFMLGQNSSAMPNLDTLDISYNLMNTIPTFSSLIDLDASSNTLNGSMYSSCMKKLQSLTISHNIITTLPDLSKFTSLVSLDASFNGIHDNFHSVLQNLPTSLVNMGFSSNSLNGVISNSHFSKFSNLKTLDLSYNHLLTFNFSRSWVPPFSLTHLNIGSCNVGPHFPNWVSTQQDLKNLDISNSSILSVIPNAFRNGITNLQFLNVSHNKLHGPIPHFLFSASKLDLSNNNFSSFSVSQDILRNSFFRDINLSNNQLSGPLPGWIFRLGLKTLNVENNKLTGDIPSSIASSWDLFALHVNNNRFSGELPSSMKNCTGLVTLEVGNNNLSGSLPLWIGDSLQQLSVLNMRSNAFTGELPSNLCNLQKLQVLDLSGNRLSGSIPGCVDNFTFMTTRYQPYLFLSWSQGYASIRWKGILEHESDVVLPLLFVIDLSNNRLTGRIPSGFTTLTHLESLDLSSNDLNGSIPDKIGQLKNLEVLKLSSNRLGGEIPQSLADLTFLNTLNLSSNNFSGEIPKSTQLQSLDPSSYAGNPDLCGEPLPTLCPWDKGSVNPPPSMKDHAEEGQESFDFEAFYAALGAGFASGVFGILGILHFHAPSRHAFFHMASEVGDWIFVWTMLCKCRIKRRLCFSKEKEAAKL